MDKTAVQDQLQYWKDKREDIADQLCQYEHELRQADFTIKCLQACLDNDKFNSEGI